MWPFFGGAGTPATKTLLPQTSPKQPKAAQVKLLKTLAQLPVKSSRSCDWFKNFSISDAELGRGTYGSVSAACLSQECDLDEYRYAAKMVELNDPLHTRMFLVEATLAKFASQKGFGVPVKHFFLCNKGRMGVIIMERMEPVKLVTLAQMQNLYEKIRQMHDFGILHCDLFLRNLLAHPETHELVISDFGLAFMLSGPVPDPLRASDLAGLLCGQPPDMYGQLAPENTFARVYDLYRRELFQDDEAWLRGLHMRVNRDAPSATQPFSGANRPYAINCLDYYTTIFNHISPQYVRKLGPDGLMKKTVWLHFCSEADGDQIDQLSLNIGQKRGRRRKRGRGRNKSRKPKKQY